MNTLKSANRTALVSILIPAYNHDKWIAETIESIISQDYSPKEIVIVNDGSTDNTATLAAAYRDKYPDVVRYYSQSNQGLCVTLNRLVGLARGEYVKIIASDDLLTRGVISDHVKRLEESWETEVMACFGPRRLIDENGREVRGVRRRKLIKGLDYFSNLLLGRSACMLQQMTFRAEAISNLGFDENLASEDIDFLLRFFAKYDALESSRPAVVYRIHQQGLSKETAQITSNTEYVLRKVETDPRFVHLGWRKILASVYFRHAVSFAVTGDIRKAMGKLADGIKRDPLALRFEPLSPIQVLIPVSVRNWLRSIRKVVLRSEPVKRPELDNHSEN